MKPILYKAKKINQDTWVEGNYFEGNEGCYITVKKNPYLKDSQGLQPFKPIEINSETVCQFIGLTDKKNKDIFEGNIVRGSYGVKHGNYGQQKDILFTGVVKYGFGQFYIKIGETKAGVDRCVYFSQLWPLSPTSVEIEIIGNIFDNPELT